MSRTAAREQNERNMDFGPIILESKLQIGVKNIRSQHNKTRSKVLRIWSQRTNLARLKTVYADMEKSKQLANVMKATKQELRELLDCDMALMFLYDEESEMLFAQLRESSTPIILSKGSGLVGTLKTYQKSENV